MSRLFNKDALPKPEPVVDQDVSLVAPRAKPPVEVGLFSDQAKADMQAVKEKAKAAAKDRAKQAGQVATQVAQRAKSEWAPKAKAWIESEREKSVRKGVWMFGGAMALLTVVLSAGIWWHAQPHFASPKAETPKVATTSSAVAPTVPVVQGTSPVTLHQVESDEAPGVVVPAINEVATVRATPVPPAAAPKPAAASALKPLPFNPTSKEFHRAQVAPKAKPVSSPKAKTAWERKQEAKLDAFFKH